MNRVFMSGAFITLAIVLAGCTKSPYYAGQKNTDALKAAVTQDTFALFHIQGKAALGQARSRRSSSGRLAVGWMVFLWGCAVPHGRRIHRHSAVPPCLLHGEQFADS